MRLKDGFQVCPNCGGQGCWRCERQGFIVQCPACANTTHIERRDDDFACSVCGAVFGKSGEVHQYEELEDEPRKKGPAQKTAPKRSPF
jgi:predicted RNA-binding Zn-ribbon protein involved in translation (DUF1610 family)